MNEDQKEKEEKEFEEELEKFLKVTFVNLNPMDNRMSAASSLTQMISAKKISSALNAFGKEIKRFRKDADKTRRTEEGLTVALLLLTAVLAAIALTEGIIRAPFIVRYIAFLIPFAIVYRFLPPRFKIKI